MSDNRPNLPTVEVRYRPTPDFKRLILSTWNISTSLCPAKIYVKLVFNWHFTSEEYVLILYGGSYFEIQDVPEVDRAINSQ